MVTDEALDYFLDAAFCGGATKTFVLGLINNSPTPSLSASDTVGSHPGWSEFSTVTVSSAFAWSSAYEGVSNLTMTAGGTLWGLFIKASDDSLLLATAASLYGTQAVDNADLVLCSFTLGLGGTGTPGEGKDFLFEAAFMGGTQVSTWGLGWIAGPSPTFNSFDTWASHPGWTESTAAGTLTWSPGAPSGGVIESTSLVADVTGTATIWGMYVAYRAPGDVGSKLIFAFPFSTGSKDLTPGDTITVMVRITATGA